MLNRAFSPLEQMLYLAQQLQQVIITEASRGASERERVNKIWHRPAEDITYCQTSVNK